MKYYLFTRGSEQWVGTAGRGNKSCSSLGVKGVEITKKEYGEFTPPPKETK